MTTTTSLERTGGHALERSSPPIRRNLTRMSAGVFGSAVLQYALYFWIARYFGSHDYGTFSIALTLAVLAAPLCDLGMSVSLVRTCSRRPETMPVVLGACLVWRAALSVPIALLGASACALAGYSDQVLGLFLLLYVAALLDGVCTLCSAVFQAREEMSSAATILLGRNLVRAAALLVAVLAGAGVGSLALVFALASGAAALTAWRMVRRKTPVRFERGALGPTIREALPFGLAIVAVTLHLQIDVALLAYFRGESEVGLYHASLRFLVLAQMIPQTVAIAVAPRAYRIGMQGVEPSAHFYRLQATALAALGLAGALLLALHGDTLVELCLGSQYAGSAVLVIAVAPVLFIKFLSSPLGDMLSGIGMQSRLTRGAWLALIVNVTANVFLIPALGAPGAVVAMLISEAFLLAYFVTVSSQAGVRHEWGSVLRHPFALAVVIAVLALAIGWLLPPLAHYGLLPCGALLYAWLLARRPTAEERTLLGRAEVREA